MNKTVFFATIFFVFSVTSGVVLSFWNEKPLKAGNVTGRSVSDQMMKASPTTSVEVKTPPSSYILPQGRFVSQSFNNCGPASLSMVMSMFGTFVDQETLADRMRPFHNPAGGVDDKSIFADEFVKYAKEQGFEALQRPNGDIRMIKTLIANDIPVVVRTWLNDYEDIGHFRIVKGYNDETGTIIQDDSYQGPNLTYTYNAFNTLWQPFNYGYILVYPKEKAAVVAAILGSQMDEETAYRDSIIRAEQELAENPKAFYPLFNIATASYYLGDYQKTVTYYEQAAPSLPQRMLWYQIEPILAYQKTGSDEAVFALTNRILNTGNQAYSELYEIRGEIYKKQGDMQSARSEFEKAHFYNTNFPTADEALNR